MASLSPVDEELLDMATLQVPWFVVCGEFHRRYGSAGALARRVIELRDAQVLQVLCTARGAVPPDAAVLEADALVNDCYSDLEKTREPEWEILTTDYGMTLIRHRVEPG